jgi:cell division protein FtsB
MSNPKSSAHYRMVVMPYRPMRRVFNTVLVLLLLVIFAVASFFYGYDQGMNQGANSDQGRQKLSELQAENETLTQEVANLKLAAMVDQQANEDVRRQALEQKMRIADLERDISVYRGMITKSGSNNPLGISIGSFQVSGSGGVRGYKYKMVVQQLAASEEVFTGTMSMKVVGSRGEERLELPLHQLSNQVSDELIPLNFKYFQSLEGDLLLPEGFVPERAVVQILSRDKRQSTNLEQQLEWPLMGL